MWVPMERTAMGKYLLLLIREKHCWGTLLIYLLLT
nr:unnamed protein product [Callosobruchus analis]